MFLIDMGSGSFDPISYVICHIFMWDPHPHVKSLSLCGTPHPATSLLPCLCRLLLSFIPVFHLLTCIQLDPGRRLRKGLQCRLLAALKAHTEAHWCPVRVWCA